MGYDTPMSDRTLGKGALIAVYIALKPIYLRSSGSMQLCDLFLVLAAVYLFVVKGGRFAFRARTGKFLLLFMGICAWQFLINAIWTGVLGANLIVSTLYYLFNFIASFVFLVIGEEIGIRGVRRSVMLGALLSLIITSLGLVLTLGTGRRTGLFNNPNQLGYYALILFTLVLLCGEEAKPAVRAVMVTLAVWAVIASASKAAFLGIVIASALYVLFIGRDKSVNSVILKLLGIAAVSVLLYTFFFSVNRLVLSSPTLVMMRRRIMNMTAENDTSLGSGRGYDRIGEMGLHFLWGMGEGAYGRFNTMTNMEVHSSFASILVSYGLIGFAAYAVLVLKCYLHRGKTLRNIVITSGVTVYQITHNGIRNTLLWLMLIVLLLEQVEASGVRDQGLGIRLARDSRGI